MEEPTAPELIPNTYQDLSAHFRKPGKTNQFQFRKETFARIEQLTKRSLICYVTKTHNTSPAHATAIDDSDLTGFQDLCITTPGDEVDVLVISNGGSAEAAERIVRLLREKYKNIRFILPANAYSAATLLSFSGNSIIMGSLATLGPIDPQINGVPARAILRAFEEVTARLKKEGPQALPAYMPLISKYDLHIFEICKSAQALSNELAASWLSAYMLECEQTDQRVTSAVDFFSNYDLHKSHGRSVSRTKARELLGEKVIFSEDIPGLSDLLRSLYNQYELWFDSTPFFKLFENARGINWGRQSALPIQIPFQFPMPGIPFPIGPLPLPQPPGQ